MYVFEPHTAIFSGLTGSGKIHRMLDLLENEYKDHFDYIVILCPTLRINETYLTRCWVRKDKRVFLVEPGDKLLEWINLLSTWFSGDDLEVRLQRKCNLSAQKTKIPMQRVWRWQHLPKREDEVVLQRLQRECNLSAQKTKIPMQRVWR